jgi:hypothetical protein
MKVEPDANKRKDQLALFSEGDVNEHDVWRIHLLSTFLKTSARSGKPLLCQLTIASGTFWKILSFVNVSRKKKKKKHQNRPCHIKFLFSSFKNVIK